MKNSYIRSFVSKVSRWVWVEPNLTVNRLKNIAKRRNQKLLIELLIGDKTHLNMVRKLLPHPSERHLLQSFFGKLLTQMKSCSAEW
ncbi:hypothetical protein Q4577_19210 [Marinovum sp. 2_MG-2023]|nr:hypothetical protein [Marinovum sp. 2_MG-2023]MDO6781483.1 hypothetical protein [Marinovum sp. 1_MG-2023]